MTYHISWFPLELEDLEKWESIFQSAKSRGILLRLKRPGNFPQNTGKIRKKLYWKIEKNTGKVLEICQPIIVKTLQIWSHALNKKKNFKNTGKLQKILEKLGKFVSQKKWKPCISASKTKLYVLS